MAAWSSAHLQEIDEISDGRVPWRPLRHHFGVTSFGVNVFTARNAGDRLINEHDEIHDGSEELYLVHTGHARFELDGEELDAPPGTFVFVPPAVKRTAFAVEDGTTLVALGGVPGKAYEPNGWEIWAPIAPLYQAGEYEQVAARLREALADDPPFGLLHYNAACVLSLTGERDEALTHLRRAIELSDQFRGYAESDSDLDAIRDSPEFVAIVS